MLVIFSTCRATVNSPLLQRDVDPVAEVVRPWRASHRGIGLERDPKSHDSGYEELRLS